MDKRFGAALSTAALLHAALIGLTVLPRHSEAPRVLETSEAAPASEIEVVVLTEDEEPSSVPGDATTSMDEARTVPQHARAAQLRAFSPQSGSAPDATAALDEAAAPDANAALAELGPDAEPEASLDGDSEARRPARLRVDLGLDGSVMRQAAMDARERASRAPRRRPVFSLGHWSENVVRSSAQRSVAWQGRALLTLEWSSEGQLLSVRVSGASSSSDEWQRLAKSLSSQLAARPNVGGQSGGLRQVYLVKSDLVLPDSKRSLLPSAKYASAGQLREKNLPPATTINLGVNADASAATTRVVSVELVSSNAL